MLLRQLQRIRILQLQALQRRPLFHQRAPSSRLRSVRILSQHGESTRQTISPRTSFQRRQQHRELLIGLFVHDEAVFRRMESLEGQGAPGVLVRGVNDPFSARELGKRENVL